MFHKNLSPAIATMMIGLSTIGYGLTPLFAKAMSNAGLASPVIVFYRFLLVTLLLLGALMFTSQKGETGRCFYSTFWESVGGWQWALAGLPILKH